MSFITQYLLHSPWWVGVVGVAAGIALFYSAHKRQDKTLQRVGIAIFTIAVILGVLGQMFPTDLEKMEKRSKDIARAVNDKDWAKLEGLMDAQTTLTTLSIPLGQGNKKIAQLGEENSEWLGITSVRATSTEGVQTDSLITVSMDVVSIQTKSDLLAGTPLPSSWQFEYQQSGDDWILQKITLLRVGQNQTGDQVVNMIKH